MFADGFTYIPLIGLLIACVWELQYCLDKVTSRQWVAYAVAGPILVISAVLTLIQIPVWTDSETLWAHALRLDADNDGAHEHIGMLRLSQKNSEEALKHFQRVVELRPESSSSICQLGRIYQQREEWEPAEECFACGTRINQDSSEAIQGLSQLHQQQRVPPQKRVVRHQPTAEALASNRLGMEHVRRSEFEVALQHFQKAALLDPQYADAQSNAGLTLTQLKLPEEAKRRYLLALELDPENPDTHVNLAMLLETEKEEIEASKHYETALQLKPSDVEARQRLNRLLKRMPAPERQ